MSHKLVEHTCRSFYGSFPKKIYQSTSTMDSVLTVHYFLTYGGFEHKLTKLQGFCWVLATLIYDRMKSHVKEVHMFFIKLHECMQMKNSYIFLIYHSMFASPTSLHYSLSLSLSHIRLRHTSQNPASCQAYLRRRRKSVLTW
jgi:hypothetical protein